jgi:hypothetical protein
MSDAHLPSVRLASFVHSFDRSTDPFIDNEHVHGGNVAQMRVWCSWGSDIEWVNVCQRI